MWWRMWMLADICVHISNLKQNLTSVLKEIGMFDYLLEWIKRVVRDDPKNIDRTVKIFQKQSIYKLVEKCSKYINRLGYYEQH